MNQQILFNLLESAGVPQNLKSVEFACIAEEPYKENFLKYLKNHAEAENGGYGLYLWSRTNLSGKSSLGVLVLKNALYKRQSVYYAFTSDIQKYLIDKTKDDYGDSIINKVFTSRYLVLDNFGEGMISEYLKWQIKDLIEKRKAHLCPTIIVSKLMPKDIKIAFNQEVADTISKCCYPMEITGEYWKTQNSDNMKKLFL